MSKYSRVISVAQNEALKSTQCFRHGAVITGKGGKIRCRGYNKGNRTKLLGNIFTCMHAEMDVINKFINGFLIPKYGNNFRKHTKKYDIWVVRLMGTKLTKLALSQPCYQCSNILKYYGFNKVYYTIDNTTLRCIKIVELVSTHTSVCQRKTAALNQNITRRLL